MAWEWLRQQDDVARIDVHVVRARRVGEGRGDVDVARRRGLDEGQPDRRQPHDDVFGSRVADQPCPALLGVDGVKEDDVVLAPRRFSLIMPNDAEWHRSMTASGGQTGEITTS